MSHFSSALQRLIEERYPARGGQTAFAKQVGIEQATISRYTNADSRPDVGMLEQICVTLEREQRAELVLAYLRDEIPPSAQDCVRVINLCAEPAAANIPEEVSRPRDRMPKKLREAFEFLEEDALKSPLSADAVLATVALMRGKRL